jgi:hypothetical protein
VSPVLVSAETSNVYIPDSKQASVAAEETKSVLQQTANGIDEIKCSLLCDSVAYCSRLNSFSGNQLKQLLRTWLSPADPSTNHNIAQKAQHGGTAAWLFQGRIVIEWKCTGSLLWIYGKRTFYGHFSSGEGLLTDPEYRSGLREERHLVRCSSPPFFRNLLFRR